MSLLLAGYAPDWATRDWPAKGKGAPVPNRTVLARENTPRRVTARPSRLGQALRKYPPAKVGDHFGDFEVVAVLPRGHRGRSDERAEIACRFCDEPHRNVNVPCARYTPPTCKQKRRRREREGGAS